MLTAALVAMIVFPALAAVVLGLVPGPGWRRALAAVVAAVVAGVAVYATFTVGPTTFREALGELPWLAGITGTAVFGVLLDPLASVMLLVATIIGFLTVLFSTRYVGTGNREHPIEPADERRYYFWLLVFLASMVGVATAPNLLQLLVFWELTTVCSWALISYYRSESSLKAGYKALLMTHVGGLFFLFAVLIVMVEAGSVEFRALAELSERSRLVVFLLLVVAAWAKAAQVPIHTWLPDAMEAPTPISAYLHAAAMVKAGVFLMARTVSAGWAMPPAAAWVLGAAALVTMFVALSYYFIQDDLKRLLAYSTISHLGYVLLGVALGALGSLTAFRGAVLHIACHGFAKATLFFCAGAVAYACGTRSIRSLSGLARTMPLVAVAFFVGVLATTGVPPFACFWSKFMLLAGAMELTGAVGPTLLVLVLVESLIAFGWMIHVGQRMFFGAASPEASPGSDPPPAMSAVLVILIAGCLLAPVLAMPFVGWIGR